MVPEEYRREADELDQHADILKRPIHDGKEEILKLEECERLEADMKQVIR